MKRIFLTGMCLLLVGVMMLNLVGCDKIRAKNLMKNITPQSVEKVDDFLVGNIAMTNFAVRLFKECEQSGQNTLISPLSVMYALAMTANGADGETLSQMEDVLGMSIDQLNEYLYSYKNSLPQGEKYTLNLANSIWFDKTLDVREDFLQTNANYYNIDIYKANLQEKSALKDINKWIKIKTEKMIPHIVDEGPDGTVMYLINALTFNAEWNEKYPKQKVKEGIFTCEDGTTQNITLMYNDEFHYIQDDNAEGFIKHYVDDKYAFVALLPNESITVSEYIKQLDGAKLNETLSNQQSEPVHVAIPKYKTEYTVELLDALKNMGMSKVLSYDADFSRIDGGKTLFIDRVTHKTFIDVNEEGTTAAAATYVSIVRGILRTEKIIHLNRPFVYMIIDCQNNVPIFMGTVMSVEN